MTSFTSGTGVPPVQYKIMKNGRRFNTKSYGSYEEARKYAIKKVRADASEVVIARGYYPALSDAGFSIRKISL